MHFCRGHHEERICDFFFLNLDQWFRRRRSLNIFIARALAALFVQRSKTICAIVVEGIMRNISVKKIAFGQVVQEEMSFNISLI